MEIDGVLIYRGNADAITAAVQIGWENGQNLGIGGVVIVIKFKVGRGEWR